MIEGKGIKETPKLMGRHLQMIALPKIISSVLGTVRSIFQSRNLLICKMELKYSK